MLKFIQPDSGSELTIIIPLADCVSKRQNETGIYPPYIVPPLSFIYFQYPMMEPCGM